MDPLYPPPVSSTHDHLGQMLANIIDVLPLLLLLLLLIFLVKTLTEILLVCKIYYF